MARESLVEKALAIPRIDKRLNKITDEEIDLAIAWMQDQISLTQAAKATGLKTPGAMISKMAIWLREGYRNNLIRVK